MARFKFEDSGNYGGTGMSGFFSLKNDKDTAAVRFMYNTLDDIEGYAVHEIEVGGKQRYINCLREYNQPVADCPLCSAGHRVLAKLFILVYDMDEEEVKIWDRGKTFFSKLSSLCARYNPLVSVPFEIERNGKKGDAKTTYETYPLEKDDTTLDDLPEAPEILGGLVLDKTFEEVAEFLETGSFGESAEVEEESIPIRGNQRQKVSKAPAQTAPLRRRRVQAEGQDKF